MNLITRKLLFTFFMFCLLSSGMAYAALPDLAVTSSDIIFNNTSAESGEVVNISATIRNNGAMYYNNTPFSKHDAQTGTSSDYIVIYSTYWLSQYFVPSSNTRLGKVSLFLKNAGDTTDSVTVEIRKKLGAVLAASPQPADLLASKTLVSTFTSFGWQDFDFDTQPMLSAGTTYWICMECLTPKPTAYYWWFDVATAVDMIGGSATQGQTWVSPSGVSGPNFISYYRLYKCTDTVVSCYKGDPGSGGLLIGTTIYSSPIPSVGNKTASFKWRAAQGSNDIYWTVDYANIILETSKSNNFAYKNINVISNLTPPAGSPLLPDLAVTSSDIVFSNNSPEVGEVIAVTANIHNNGGIYFNNTPVLKHDSTAGFTSYAPVFNNKWYSQYFVSGENQYLGKVSLSLRNMGDTSDLITVRILNSKGDELKPAATSGSILASKSLVSTSTSYGWTDFVFDTAPFLTAGATYWISAQNSGSDLLSGYRWLVDTGTANNMLTSSSDQGQTWQTQNPPSTAYFKIYKTTDTVISLYNGDPNNSGQLISKNIIPTPIPALGTKKVSFNWTALKGNTDIYIAADLSNIIQESQENNNTAYRSLSSLLNNPDISGNVSPPENSSGIDVSEPVSVTFNKEMDPVLAGQSISVKAIKDNRSSSLSQAVSGTVNYVNKSLTFNAAWAKGYTYQITISTTAKDTHGNALLNPKIWSFKTIMDQLVQNVFIDDAQTKIVLEPGTITNDYYISVDTNPLVLPSLNSKILQANDKIEKTRGQFSSPVTSSIRRLTAYNTSGTQISGQFQKSITITLPYVQAANGMVKDSNGLLVKEKTLGLYVLDELNSLWIKIPNSSVDTAAHTVSADVDHFSVYAIFGGSDLDISNAYAFPVPWKPFGKNPASGTLAAGITFTNLGSQATIKIYTLSGALVRALQYQYSGGNEQLAWDGKNLDGELVASGVYIYYIENAKEHKSGKLIIIK